eukprot:gene10077-18726_t
MGTLRCNCGPWPSQLCMSGKGLVQPSKWQRSPAQLASTAVEERDLGPLLHLVLTPDHTQNGCTTKQNPIPHRPSRGSPRDALSSG